MHMVVYGERVTYGSFDDLIKYQRIIWGPRGVWNGASRKLNPVQHIPLTPLMYPRHSHTNPALPHVFHGSAR